MGDTDDSQASETSKSKIHDSADILDKFDYEIAKWIANSALKRNKKAVDEEMARHERLETLSKTSALGAISDYVLGGQTQRENQSLLIDEYWSSVSIDVKYKGLSRQQIRGLLVLQNAFRTWIILKRYRDTLKTKASDAARSFGDVKGIATSLYIQSSVRRVIAKLTVETKISENKIRDKIFAKFCGLMKEGIMVTMFSRKYGTAPSRKISFDNDLNNLTFSTSFGTRGKIALKSIYKIHKGISQTMYPHSRQAQLSRCICLECLGERVVDMELTNAQQAREMYIGFERLILLLSGTKSPFYIDNFGIPRRAGPSIIENAINEATVDDDYSNRIYKSKPDEMRFWGAVRLLQQEYDTWQQEQDAERREHNKKKEEEAEKVANKLNEREKAMAEGRGGGRKVTKLVRFVDADGENQLVEQMDKKNMRASYDDGQVITVEKADKGKKKKTKEYDVDTSGKGKKWKFNPFKKRGKKAGSETSNSAIDTNEVDAGGFDYDPFTKKAKRGISENSNSVKSVQDYGGKYNGEIDFHRSEEMLNREKQRGLAQDALGAMSSDDINEILRSRSNDQTASEVSRSRKFSEVLSQTSFDDILSPPDIAPSTTHSTGGSVRLSDDLASDVSADPKAYSVSLRRSTRSMSDVSSISKSSAVVQSFWSVLFCQAPMRSYESDDDYSVVIKNAIISGGRGESKGSSSRASGGAGGGSGSSDEDEDSDEEDSGGESVEDSQGTAVESSHSAETASGRSSGRSSGRARNSSGSEATSSHEEVESEEEEKEEDSSEGSSVGGGRSSRSTFSGHQAYESDEEGDGEEKEGDEDDFSQSEGPSSHSTFSGQSGVPSTQSTFSGLQRYRPQDDEDEVDDEEDSDRDSDSPSEDDRSDGSDGSDAHSEDAVADGNSFDGFDEDN